MNKARRIVLVFYCLGIALVFLWVPWSEHTGYWWLWSAPRPTSLGKDVVAETREQWKKEARANESSTLGQKWAQEVERASDQDREKVKSEIRFARAKAEFRKLQLTEMLDMSDEEVLAWLKQDENFNSTFPERVGLDAARRKTIFEEWERTVPPAKDWNRRVEYAKTDYRRIGFELVVLTALCTVALLLTVRS